MGQKVNPIGFRIGINRDWSSRWYANNKDYAGYLHEDIKIRKYLTVSLKDALLSHIDIERVKGVIKVFIFVARPGVVFGQNGEKIAETKKALLKILKLKEIQLEIVEIKGNEIDMDASLVAQSIASQLEQRASFRTVQKKAIQRTMKAGAKGIKTRISGRLAGADIARSEGYKEGVLSLHTLRQNIDYALAEAHTTYGRLGVKVWISKGETKPTKKRTEEKGE